jgi:hypothetical protein
MTDIDSNNQVLHCIRSLYPSDEKQGQKHAILAKPQLLQVNDPERRAYFG